jgi:hypothetical protein
MQCWICASPASGTCRFCGRAICRDDAKTRAYILEVYRALERLYGLAIEDALYCGVCTPKPEPVEMEFLEPQPRSAKKVTKSTSGT